MDKTTWIIVGGVASFTLLVFIVWAYQIDITPKTIFNILIFLGFMAVIGVIIYFLSKKESVRKDLSEEAIIYIIGYHKKWFNEIITLAEGHSNFSILKDENYDLVDPNIFAGIFRIIDDGSKNYGRHIKYVYSYAKRSVVSYDFEPSTDELKNPHEDFKAVEPKKTPTQLKNSPLVSIESGSYKEKEELGNLEDSKDKK